MLKMFSLLVCVFMAIPVQAAEEFWRADLLHENLNCLLKVTRKKMGSASVSAAPQLKVESETPLSEFQDAMEKFWRFRPDFFLNVYDVNTNTIYLMNKKNSYKAPRTPVDSLVHELAHFVQVKDRGHGMEDGDALESEAVQVQTWFRENRGNFISEEKYQGPCE